MKSFILQDAVIDICDESLSDNFAGMSDAEIIDRIVEIIQFDVGVSLSFGSAELEEC